MPDNAAPRPHVAGSAAPRPHVAGSAAPRPHVAGPAAPRPHVARPAAPRAHVAGPAGPGSHVPRPHVAGSAAPRTTLELLENVPESLLRKLKQYSGRFATEAVAAMQDRLPFFAELDASQRASVHLVVQTAVVNFLELMKSPHNNVLYTVQAFEVVPQDL